MDISELAIFSKIDFSKINLPSDGITLKHLRLRFPQEAETVVDRVGERLDAMGNAERLFILIGYAAALGKEELAKVEACIELEGGKAEAVGDMTADLIHFGLADGPATAARMIDKLQQIGASLAQPRQGIRRTNR